MIKNILKLLKNKQYRLKTSVSWQEVIKINWTIFIIIWFAIGFVGMIYMHLSDMRGEEFDENYFDKECVLISFVAVLFGCFLPIIFWVIWCSENKPFTKLLYKIANVGLNKK